MQFSERWLRTFVDPPLDGDALAHALTMAGLEVEEARFGADLRDYLALADRVLTLKLTPNRADCLGMVGLGRDVAAITGAPYVPLTIEPAPPQSDDAFSVRLTDPLACGRFAGRVIKGVDARAGTPLWMKQRLERSGVRSISAIVDVTNYVMLELNRPLHAYDLGQ